MDDATARTRTLGRRMASAKPAAAPRRSAGSGSPRRGDEPQISPARWAGVALVMVAILAAIVLAVVSPSESGSDDQPGTLADAPSPTPAASPLDTRRPLLAPTIVSPGDTTTAEYEIALTVEVPTEEALPRKLLTLVVLRGDEELRTLEKPKLGSKVTIEGVSLLERSDNELTVALRSAAGYGPESSPVLVTHDPDAPTLTITAPANGTEVYDRTIQVEGTSEAGAKVTIRNQTTGWGPVTQTVDSGGGFEESVKLEYGKNAIVVESQGRTAVSPPQVVRVIRRDGRPRLANVKVPKVIKKSSLPGSISVKVMVTDDRGDPMADAIVAYSLSSLTSPADTYSEVTGPDGRSAWKPEVAWSSSLADDVQLTLTVTSPHDETVSKTYDIPIS